MKSRRRSLATACCAARSEPSRRSVYSRTIHGAAITPATVTAASATRAIVVTALVASSSSRSRCSTKTGTNVAESTPPRSSS
ncbi:MAG: hypothetical protein M5U14_16435 [Acidimicrobiia bacterium]|nr:hypothetical protein [Acidimicrobiia bacterium]